MLAAEELEDLLEKERAAILQGRIQDLEGLGARKLALLSAVERGSDTSAKQLKTLSILTRRNASLLSASGRGIKAAIRQIGEANTQKHQAFYGPDGERKPMVPLRERLEQKL
ncbi:MAG: hypothetical protein KJO30_00440 [Boseongicola sp.]|nr:hypothetical protein [Boseongicola sp.]NNJ66423.1 hypothetical protein [Boseongicola sp.]